MRPTLIIGGLPRERLPLVIGLLGFTAALVVVALLQLRREAELARLARRFRVRRLARAAHAAGADPAVPRDAAARPIPSGHEGRWSLEIIAREAQRLAHLVENVLLFSRGERRAPAIRETARLAPMIVEVVGGFAPLAAAAQARIVTGSTGVQRVVDAGALRQILLNLLDNAVKYGPPGQTITVASVSSGTRRA